MAEQKLTFHQLPSPIATQVHLGHGLLYSQKWLQTLTELSGQPVVVSDTNLKEVLVDRWVAWLNEQGVSVLQLTFAAGEMSKTRKTKEELEDQLFSRRYGKDTVMIAVGGGVATDLVGYLASTFCRGVPLISVPTSLLAMVDAVVGGKTGVNTPFGKNLVGTFYPAAHIVIDPATLLTLPEREWRNGVAEVIKHGLIRSPRLIEQLEKNVSLWSRRDPAFLQEVIYESVLIKKEVVEADFQETGYRRALNFGHTVGHAVELLENYAIPHGEAVAIGMLAEGMLSHRLGLLSIDGLQHIEQILKQYLLPLKVSDGVTIEGLISAMALDKKAEKATPRFVLLEKIGQPAAFDGAYCTTVDPVLLREVLAWVLSYIRGHG